MKGAKVVPLPGDIRDEKFCKRLVADAVNQLGGLDILVSNAGKQVYQESLLDISTEQLDATFRTNVYAMVWITQAALPHLQPGASIICTTSINAYDPSPGILDYAMTKGAIAIFIKGLSKQLIPKGFESTVWLRDLSGRRFNPAVASPRNTSWPSGVLCPWVDQASQRNLRQRTFSWPLNSPAMSAAKSTALPEAIQSHNTS